MELAQYHTACQEQNNLRTQSLCFWTTQNPRFCENEVVYHYVSLSTHLLRCRDYSEAICPGHNTEGGTRSEELPLTEALTLRVVSVQGQSPRVSTSLKLTLWVPLPHGEEWQGS